MLESFVEFSDRSKALGILHGFGDDLIDATKKRVFRNSERCENRSPFSWNWYNDWTKKTGIAPRFN
jgi:hypothetical protein